MRRKSSPLLGTSILAGVVLAVGVAVFGVRVLVQGHPTATSTLRTATASTSTTDAKSGQPTGPGQVRTLAPDESFVPGVGAYWVPAEASTPHSVPAAQAIMASASYGIPAAFGIATAPEATLATFSNDVKGAIQRNGSVVPDDHDVITWVLRYTNVPVVGRGGAVSPGALCGVYVAVDANTDVVREAFQSCDRRVG